jgi:hypothetical protein
METIMPTILQALTRVLVYLEADEEEDYTSHMPPEAPDGHTCLDILMRREWISRSIDEINRE